MQNTHIYVQGLKIEILTKPDNDYISLTDILKAKNGDFFVSDWLRNRNTIEFLGIWEEINNPDFNYGEFAIIKTKAGLNSYKISIKEWVQKTNAIGIRAYTGRYGKTFAHKDIAFEFGMWISPRFKMYLIKEFQRLKLEESQNKKIDWSAKRMLTKINYHIHTDAIHRHIIVPNKVSLKESSSVYAHEADVLNVALFGKTAKKWREENINKEGNIRDYADIYQLVCLSNLESINSLFIEKGLSQQERLIELNKVAISQMQSLLKHSAYIQKLTS